MCRRAKANRMQAPLTMVPNESNGERKLDRIDRIGRITATAFQAVLLKTFVGELPR